MDIVEGLIMKFTIHFVVFIALFLLPQWGAAQPNGKEDSAVQQRLIQTVEETQREGKRLAARLDSVGRANALVKSQLETMQAAQAMGESALAQLRSAAALSQKEMRQLKRLNDSLQRTLDSLRTVCGNLEKAQEQNSASVTGKIESTSAAVAANQQLVKKRTVMMAIVTVAIALALLSAILVFVVRMRKGSSTVDRIRRTQESLQQTQTKMQEESIKLDNKLLELAEQQLSVANEGIRTVETPDHSLVVKLADEIARIETNLSKMDKSVRGYKQLVQAKDRMINNVRANGYEIISLLGQEYNDGMQFPARFVPDDTLPEGKRVITGMIKMQVNYNGKMIQPAEIVVSQNI